MEKRVGLDWTILSISLCSMVFLKLFLSLNIYRTLRVYVSFGYPAKIKDVYIA